MFPSCAPPAPIKAEVFILATGESVSQKLADSLKGRFVIAVSDAYKLAPWANVLVSQDKRWWNHNPEAMKFEGLKYGGWDIKGVEQVAYEGPIATSSNSGLLAAFVAHKVFKATRIILCGIDLHGSHFFGLHPEPLRNTKPHRFDIFQRQFAEFKPKGVEILNASPISRLSAYPKVRLEDVLSESALHAA